MDLEPLFRLRLQTPRLELRLPTHQELCDLREVAARGIHPASEMPFAIAWTDEPYSEGFVVKFNEQMRQQWKPEDWHLVLGVWAGEQPIGTQAVSAKAFAANRAVTSGSWLGQAFQGKGYGTEMRAAVLELAFHGLGAERAESAWLDGSHASRRVSEKLGYRVVGRGTVSPRGRPTGETKVEIRREDWLSPFDVVIANLEPALPLFGIDA